MKVFVDVRRRVSKGTCALMLAGFSTLSPLMLQAGGVVADCSESSLRAAMAGGGTVTFACDGTITLTQTITNTLDTTLDASGHQVTIDGRDSVRVFCVTTNVSVEFVNLTIAHGLARKGGAILNVGGDVNLNHVQFQANRASYEAEPQMSVSAAGGGIFNQAGTVAATNCVFVGNFAQQATDASTSPSRTRGGALYNESGEVKLAACCFTNNSASGAPGPFNIRGTAHEAEGGAVANAGKLEANLCTFFANFAVGGRGGGIAGEGGPASGGAFCNLGTAVLNACVFMSNSVSGGSGGYGESGMPGGPTGDGGAGGVGGWANGGALFNAGNAVIADCVFIGNVGAGGEGGMGGAGYPNPYPYPYPGGNGGPGGQGGAAIGAICDINALCLLTNCVVSSNITIAGIGGAGGPGGGGSPSGADGMSGSNGQAMGALRSVGAIVMQSTLNANVPGGDCFGSFTDGGGNTSSDCSCAFTNTLPPKAGPPDLPAFRIIHNFTGQEQHTADAHPYSSLVADPDGNIYGVTTGGAWPGAGAVYRVNSNGTDSSFMVLRWFYDSPTWGTVGGLVLSDNVLYGNTKSSGEANLGTVFKINTDGSGYVVLHSFGSGGDGMRPAAGMALLGSTLYGTTQYGGNANYGIIFRIETNGSGYSILKHFQGTTDGGSPHSELVRSGDTFFGTTSGGSQANGSSVFKINTDGSGFVVLKYFDVADSSLKCWAGLALSGATLFGTTSANGYYGNPDCGSVFKVNTNGNGFQIIKPIPGTDAPGRDAGVICWGDLLLGTTTGDGGLTSHGAVFTMKTDGSGYTVFKRFNGIDGSGPNGTLLMLDNTLYGTTENGGFYGAGVLFALSLSPPDIVSSLQSQTVELGSSVDFAVEATGFPTLSCQWFFNTNTPVARATNLSLHLEGVQYSQSGAYTLLLSNPFGAITSAPAMLNVIAPVERRLVPGLSLTGDLETLLNLESRDDWGTAANWVPLATIPLEDSPQWWFDLTEPLPAKRFYRSWQSGVPVLFPSLHLELIPALMLTGETGSTVRVDAINAIGPTDAWFTLATVTLTNTSQAYVDVTAPGQPARLYRFSVVP